MGNTFSCLNVHFVFSTKERVPILNPEVRERLWPYLQFVPGYFRLVPPGQDTPFRCRIFLKLALMGRNPGLNSDPLSGERYFRVDAYARPQDVIFAV
jgi:hypothetical protein